MKAYFERMSLSVMKRYEPKMAKWHYEHGLVIQAVWNAGKVLNNGLFCDWAKSMYEALIDKDGAIAGYKDGEFNLDMINAGKLLFDLYAETGDKRYKTAIDKLAAQMKDQPRTASGGFWHKKIYPYQMWLDGVYMAEPFNARYAAEFGKAEYEDDIVKQFKLMYEKARDPKTGLLYHAWDESKAQRWANPETGCSPHFWGRALGWFCMALADTLDYLSENNKAPLIEIANSLFEPVIAAQDAESGLWYQLLALGGMEKNYLESSASAMFTYFFLKSLRKGYVKKNETLIEKSAKKAWEGLVRLKIKEDADGGLHLIDVCSVAGLGGTPYRDGSYDYYVSEPIRTDDFKGVGPFILAGINAET